MKNRTNFFVLFSITFLMISQIIKTSAQEQCLVPYQSPSTYDLPDLASFRADSEELDSRSQLNQIRVNCCTPRNSDPEELNDLSKFNGTDLNDCMPTSNDSEALNGHPLIRKHHRASPVVKTPSPKSTPTRDRAFESLAVNLFLNNDAV